MSKRSSFYTDDQGRVRYIGGRKKAHPASDIPLTAPHREKGNFITTDDGRVVFIGGPSSGGGTSSSTSLLNKLANNSMSIVEGKTYKKGDYPSVKVNIDEAGDAILKENVIREGKSASHGVPSTAQSEVAAYEVAQELGYNNLVPPTTFRGNASIQAWIDDSVRSDKYTKSLAKKFGPVDEDSVKQVLIFDALTDSSDRHPGNMIIAQVGGKSRVIAIDNGLAFGANNVAGLRDARDTVRLTLTYDGYTLEDTHISKPRLTSSDLNPVRRLLSTPTFWESMKASIGERATTWMHERAEYMVTPDFLEAEW